MQVATPFPPRNPAQTGQICPTIANEPERTAVVTDDPAGPNAREGSAAQRSPLATSAIPAMIPFTGPSTRMALVPPALPLPRFLRSTRAVNRDAISVEGIEPMRYDTAKSTARLIVGGVWVIRRSRWIEPQYRIEWRESTLPARGPWARKKAANGYRRDLFPIPENFFARCLSVTGRLLAPRVGLAFGMIRSHSTGSSSGGSSRLVLSRPSVP